ncbi:MAG: PKD domain-containing protein [Acidimicrobiales bacterium]
MKFSWGVAMVVAMIATLTTTVGQAGAANNNPPFEGYFPPPGYTLTVNGQTGAQVVTDGDILTFELTEHAYNACSEGPTTPGCLSNIAWRPWFDRSYVAPFGTGANWGFSYEILDPDDCASDSYSCTVRITTTRTVPCTGLPLIGNIAPLLTYVSGDLGLGFGSSSLPYVIQPQLFVDFGAQDCQPISSLSWDNVSANPLEIDFDASGAYDPDNLDLSDPYNPVGPGDGIVSYSWDFGDGAISFDPSPVHIYNEPGYYDVSVTVTDDEGDIAMTLDTIQVSGFIDPDFTWSYPDSEDPFTVEFDASPTTADSEIYDWYWDFGDGDSDSGGPTITHTYAELGEVDVTLYVQDEFGGDAEITKTVDVGEEPPVGGLPSVSSPFGFGFDEGDAGESSTVLIPLELSEPSATPVTVSWATTAQPANPFTATLGVDYPSASGQVVIPAGSVEGFIELTIFGDDIDEEDEAAWVEITGATGATFTPGELAYVVLLDDDDPPVATPVSVVTTEGDVGTTTAEIIVELSAPSAKTVTVDYVSAPAGGVIDGGAADFVPTAGTVTFAPGETSQSIPVEVIGDTTAEPGLLFGAEWAGVRIMSPTNASVPGGWNSVAFLLIVDDDVAVS